MTTPQNEESIIAPTSTHQIPSAAEQTTAAPAPGTRAVIYLRVSTPGQVKTDYDPEGISLPAQREACTRKAEQLGLTIVDEYIEPGRTATEMTKRVEFQRMLTRVRNEYDVDHIIVYKLSRMARNRYDDAIVMADLKKRGVSLISATESIDDSSTGQLMHGILATINEYQSRESGADIAYKMSQKAKHGGTLGRAPLGFTNIIERIDGRDIRTVALDPERAPLVRLAFELYATGDYTLADLSDELAERGLRTRPTNKYPAQAVSVSKLSRLLRDRYYIGILTYKGEPMQGRHEPLIDEDLFERVQLIVDSRSAAQERRRVHHHYLKGSLYCGHCHQQGRRGRMIIQHTVNARGSRYTYFFCINKQTNKQPKSSTTQHACPSAHMNVSLIEEAVEAHYATIKFSPGFIADVRAHVAAMVDEEQCAAHLLHQQLTTKLQALDAKESNLLDLAADGALPQAKIRAKLHDIARQRDKLTARLGQTSRDLSEAATLLDLGLTLLEHPQELYRRCDDEQKRLLNQALFQALYIEEDDIVWLGRTAVTGHVLKEPFHTLHAVQERYEPTPGAVTGGQGTAVIETPNGHLQHAQGDTRAENGTQGAPASEADNAIGATGAAAPRGEANAQREHPDNESSAPPHQGKDAASCDTVDVLLAGMPGVQVGGCSSSRFLVGAEGFEPPTLSV